MKLIRDNTPDLQRGTTRFVRDDEEWDILLRAKLMEEAAEVSASTSKEEMIAEFGDLYEVMLTLAGKKGIELEQIISSAVAKYERKGGFEVGTVLMYDPLSNKTGVTI